MRSIYRDVLGIPDIDDDSNFFALGGDSHQAVQIAKLIWERVGVAVDFVEVLNNPTVGRLDAVLASRPDRDVWREDGGPATSTSSQTSPLQRSLYALDQLTPEGAVIEPIIRPVPARLDAGMLAESLQEVLARHDVLRSTFAIDSRSGELRTTVRSACDAGAFTHTSVNGMVSPSTLRGIQLEALCDRFDVGCEPPLRIRLLTCSESISWLVLSCHHLVSDALTVGTVESELLAFYRLLEADTASEATHQVAAPPNQFADYVQRLQLWCDSSDSDPARQHWRDALAGWHPPHCEVPASAASSFAAQREDRLVDNALTRALRATSTRLDVSLAVLTQACVRAAVSAVMDRTDLVLGVAATTRDAFVLDSDVGPYVNVLPVRTVAAPDDPFFHLVRGTDLANRAALAHRFLPIEYVQADLGHPRGLYDVGFSHQRVAETPKFLELIGSRSPAEPSGVPLVVLVYEGKDHLRLRLRYRPSVVSAERLEEMWAAILDALAAACSLSSPPAGRTSHATSSWGDETFVLRLDG